MMNHRPLANTGLQVSEVALGCWPIAGMTSPGTSDTDSIATIQACFDFGINHLDTAYMYGRNGESERLIARALGPRRDAPRSRPAVPRRGGVGPGLRSAPPQAGHPASHGEPPGETHPRRRFCARMHGEGLRR